MARPLSITWLMTTQEKIIYECERVKNILLAKNAAYGDSALNPVGVFSKLSAEEAIKIRLDDKLARIRNRGIDDATEDTLDDLIGYLVLLQVARKSN